MTMKKIDATIGRFLRWLANLFTGNTFIRLRRELRSDMREATQAALEARDIARRMHDTQQKTMLLMFKQTGGSGQ